MDIFKHCAPQKMHQNVIVKKWLLDVSVPNKSHIVTNLRLFPPCFFPPMLALAPLLLVQYSSTTKMHNYCNARSGEEELGAQSPDSVFEMYPSIT